MFQFGEDLFDGVEVGGIGRQEQKPGSASPDGAALLDKRAPLDPYPVK